MAQAFDLVSNVHTDWCWTKDPMVRNSGINIRRVVNEEGKVQSIIIVIDRNPMYNLLAFEILRTTIKFYLTECRRFNDQLVIRIPIDDNFGSVDGMIKEEIGESVTYTDSEYKLDTYEITVRTYKWKWFPKK